MPVIEALNSNVTSFVFSKWSNYNNIFFIFKVRSLKFYMLDLNAATIIFLAFIN